MNGLKRILLVEDDPKDVELTLTGLAEYNLANEVVIARDGEEALDYLYRRAITRRARTAIPGDAARLEIAEAQWLRGARAGSS